MNMEKSKLTTVLLKILGFVGLVALFMIFIIIIGGVFFSLFEGKNFSIFNIFDKNEEKTQSNTEETSKETGQNEDYKIDFDNKSVIVKII